MVDTFEIHSYILFMNCCCSVTQSFLTLFYPHGLQHVRLPYPSLFAELFVFEDLIVWLYHNLSIHQLTNIWNVSRFQLVINNLQIFVYNYAFIWGGKYLRIKNMSCMVSACVTTRIFPTVFSSVYIPLHSHQQCMRFIVTVYICQKETRQTDTLHGIQNPEIYQHK